MKKILIINSNYYGDISKKLLLNAKKKLKKKVKISVLEVPGVYEIPIAIRKNINKYDGFIALGCVIKGQTPHFDLICSSLFNSILNLSINFNKIKICDELYTFSFTEVMEFIRTIDNIYSNVVLVGHNPAYTEISNYFSENKILNLPTARWFCLKFDTDSWSEIIGLKPTYYINNINSES